MSIFDSTAKFEAIKSVLECSRWFDESWMVLDKHEGYRAIGKFGLRSGPAFESYAFYHDLAHALVAVQDGQAWRLEMKDFSLRYAMPPNDTGDAYFGPMTDQAIQLELRTFALQRHLATMDDDIFDEPVMESETDDEFFQSHVGSLIYMDDFINARAAYSEKHSDLSYEEVEKHLLQAMVERCRAVYHTIEAEAVFELWRVVKKAMT